MTVIKDPGNVAESYSDAAVRNWRTTAGLWKGDSTTWQSRANSAWGASGTWNSGSSYQTDSANNAANATTWQGRANQAWGENRSWSSGPSFESQAWSGGVYGSGSLYSTLYTNQTNAYNALLAGLNSPDGLQNASYSISHVAGGTEVGIGTFTFARSGHFFVTIWANAGGSPTQNNATSTLRVAGAVATTQTANVGSTSGARNWWHVFVADVDVTAGATISVFYNCFATGNPTTGTCWVQAHFVPNATYHN